MGRFRDRMDDDLRIRGYSANTRACYLRYVRHYVRHFMRPPDQLTPEHIRQYQLFLTRDRQDSWPSVNQVVCALRFFFCQVLKKGSWPRREETHAKWIGTQLTLTEEAGEGLTPHSRRRP